MVYIYLHLLYPLKLPQFLLGEQPPWAFGKGIATGGWNTDGQLFLSARWPRLRSPSRRWPRQTCEAWWEPIFLVSFSCVYPKSSATIAWLFRRTFIPYLICISCMFLFICEVKHVPIRSSVFGVWTGWIIRYVQTWPPKNMCCSF